MWILTQNTIWIWDSSKISRRAILWWSFALGVTTVLSGCKSEEEKEAERIAEMNKRNKKNKELLEHFNSGWKLLLVWKWWDLSCYQGKADRNTANPRNAKIYLSPNKWQYGEDLYMVEMKKNWITPDLLKGSFSWVYLLSEHCIKLEEVE